MLLIVRVAWARKVASLEHTNLTPRNADQALDGGREEAEAGRASGENGREEGRESKGGGEGDPRQRGDPPEGGQGTPTFSASASMLLTHYVAPCVSCADASSMRVSAARTSTKSGKK